MSHCPCSHLDQFQVVVSVWGISTLIHSTIRLSGPGWDEPSKEWQGRPRVELVRYPDTSKIAAVYEVEEHLIRTPSASHPESSQLIQTADTFRTRTNVSAAKRRPTHSNKAKPSPRLKHATIIHNTPVHTGTLRANAYHLPHPILRLALSGQLEITVLIP
ncbi:hypothetical protein JAAARDRAFT_198457 [Jaapia argillacea MUCL 33604]|uniref:Uncharacterized protein n=1 Tax=Jaapia argillacea MUCL 33604 TaxID=933084 RepID=A0A067PPN7_9AGAM|nr:hypothetical protein JAAARDRAFT_198457 [Jaapia argillacea MUCL 33604]